MPTTNLDRRIESGKPVVIAEIAPPQGADPAPPSHFLVDPRLQSHLDALYGLAAAALATRLSVRRDRFRAEAGGDTQARAHRRRPGQGIEAGPITPIAPITFCRPVI